MAIQYKIVKQCEPGVEGGGCMKYYARVCNRNMVGTRKLCELISARSTLSGADSMAMLTILSELIPELLMQGFSVKLGDTGIFSVAVKSRSAGSEEELKPGHIHDAVIRFRPSVEMKQQMKGAKFKKIK